MCKKHATNGLTLPAGEVLLCDDCYTELRGRDGRTARLHLNDVLGTLDVFRQNYPAGSETDRAFRRCADVLRKAARLRALIRKWESRVDHGFNPEEDAETTAFWRGAQQVLAEFREELALTLTGQPEGK